MKKVFTHSLVHLLVVTTILAPAAPVWAQNENTPRRGQSMVLNFQDADIEAVARTMGVIAGRNVMVDPRVKGVISLQSDRTVSPSAAWNQFTMALRMQGFTVVSSGGIDKIVPEADAKLQGGSVFTSGPANAGSGQIVTQIFKLNHENANNLVPILRPLISPNNTINVNPSNNSLIITDYGDNLQRLAKIISSMDVSNATDIEVLPVRYAVASEIAPLLIKLLEGSGSGAGAGADTSFKNTIIAENRTNSLIIRSANKARINLIRSLVSKLDRPNSGALGEDSGYIHVVHLKNADATKLAVSLRALMASNQPFVIPGVTGATGGSLTPAPLAGTGGASGSSQNQTTATSALQGSGTVTTGGQIQADPATNSLIITAPAVQYRQIRAIIDKLDQRRAQVYVEALIAEVSTDKASEIGIQWQTPVGKEGNQTIGVLGTNFSQGSGGSIISLAAGGAAGLANLGKGINIGVGRMLNGSYYLGALAHFLESVGDTNILSAPNILTMDNEEARIMIGQNVPFITGQYSNSGGNANTVNPFQTIERKDIGLTLRVKPQISENGNIMMQVFQEVSSLSSSSAAGPITNKRSVESNIMVQDGSVVVIGGLLQDEQGNNVQKIPLLGDLPLVGALFRSDTRSRRKTNLMIFLRPVVMRDAMSTENFSSNRYEAMRANMGTDNRLTPVLPERYNTTNSAPVDIRTPQIFPQQPAPAPVYQAPVYQAPVTPAPVYQAPIYQAPVTPTPIYQAPIYQAPVYQAPVSQTPAYSPTQVAPAAQQPRSLIFSGAAATRPAASATPGQVHSSTPAPTKASNSTLWGNGSNTRSLPNYNVNQGVYDTPITGYGN